MKKTIAYRGEGGIWIAAGVAALVVHTGCFNSGGLSVSASASGHDSGNVDGRVVAFDGSASKDTRTDLAGIDSARAGMGGGTTTGSGGAAGTGGLATGGTPTGGFTGSGGTTDPDTKPGDADVIDAPQLPPPGGSGGSGAGGSGGSGGGGSSGSGGGGSSGGSGGTSTQSPPDTAPHDGAVDRPPDTPPDGPACIASACPAPTSGNGTAICLNGVCSITCNDGYHRCGNTCALNASPTTCGTGPNSCSPCPAGPSGASATCSGSPLACGFTCNSGYHSCGSLCVVNGSTDRNSCGNNCTVCQAAPANGSVACNGTTCIASCNAGFHLCGSLCVANSSVSGCGSRCTACPTPTHGSATCTGSSPVCGITCSTNYHQCDNTCVSNTDPNNCGPSCATCAGDAHGRATCSGNPGSCGITCRNGYQWCAKLGKCVDPTDPTTCGSNCDQCPAAPGSIATCAGNPPRCALAPQPCTDPGKHVCGFACVDEGVTSCGDSCTNCPGGGTTVPHSRAVCSRGTCGLVCVDGFHDCSADGAQNPNCVANDSVLGCGSGCVLCPVPAHGQATCAGGTTCGVDCDDGYHQCGTNPATCVSDRSTSLDSCGSKCEACTTFVDPTIAATCDGSKCGLGCTSSSSHFCADPLSPNSGSCFPNDDALHCYVGGAATCGACDSGEVCKGGTCVTAPTSTDTATATSTGTSTANPTDTSTTTATDTSATSVSH